MFDDNHLKIKALMIPRRRLFHHFSRMTKKEEQRTLDSSFAFKVLIPTIDRNGCDRIMKS